jgi:hypothetical protein
MILAWAYIEGIVAFSSAAPSIFNRYTLTGKLHTVFSKTSSNPPRLGKPSAC